MQSQRRIGRYQVLEEIASGGQGTVYRAWDTDSGRVVALKVLHPHLSSDAGVLERFRREAQLAAAVAHPNITTIYEVGHAGNLFFIAMEFLPLSIHNLIESQGSLPVERAADICYQAALALQAASSRGIIHRDIKPQNLLLAPDGSVKVTDFGIARATALSTMTRTGALMGTPHYMSPEQSRGQRVDVRSDIYSLGVVLYQMLSGQLPFEASTPFEVMRQHIEDRPTPVRRLRSQVPAALERIVQRCLEKSPERRYRTPVDLAQALQEAVPSVGSTRGPQQQPVQPPAQRPAQQPAQPPAQRPAQQPARPPAQRPAAPRSSRPRSVRPGTTWMESWARSWQRAHRNRYTWIVAVLSLAAALVAIAVNLGVMDPITNSLNRESAPQPAVAVVGATEAQAVPPTPTTTPAPPAPTTQPVPMAVPIGLQLVVSEGSFTTISSGWWHTCALRQDGTAVCWGLNDEGQASPPDGERFKSITAGWRNTCGLNLEGIAVCWGSDPDGQAPPPSERLVSIASGQRHTCGLRSDAAALCWGLNEFGQASPPPGERLVSLSLGHDHTCGLREDGTVVCWGSDVAGQVSSLPGERFIFLGSSTGALTCGLRENRTAACWGADGDGRASPPSVERFTSISSGVEHTCAVRENGTAACWGSDSFGQASPPPDLEFTYISSGAEHTCGLRPDGSAVCWGYDEHGQASPPQAAVARAEPAPTRAPSPPESRYGNELHLAIAEDPYADGFLPFENVSSAKREVNSLIFSRLFRQTPSGIVPDLGESWEVSEDWRKLTVAIRQDARFHDGRPVTAEDVSYSIMAFQEVQASQGFEDLQKEGGLSWTSWVQDGGVSIIDDYTLEIRFSEPFPNFPEVMAQPTFIIVPHRMWFDGDLHGRDPDNVIKLVGSGPFKPVEYVPGVELVLERNPHYYEPNLPYVDRITIHVVPERATRIAAFLTGQIDFLGIPNNGYRGGIGRGELEYIVQNVPDTVLVPPSSAPALWFDTQTMPFADMRVRRAIAYAIDQDVLNEALLESRGERQGPVPKALFTEWTAPLDDPNARFRGYHYDPGKARQLLAEAGYPDGFETQLMVSDRWVEWGRVVAEMLAEVGIVTGMGIFPSEYMAGIGEFGPREIPHQGMVLAPFQRFDGDIELFIREHFTRQGTHNYSRWTDGMPREVLLEFVGSELDPEKRRELVFILIDHLVEEVVVVPLSAPPAAYARSGRVRGALELTDLGTMMKQVWIEEAAAVRPATPSPTPAAPPASIKGTVLYNGRPLPEATDATPSFSVFIRDVYDHAEVPLYDNSTGQYEILGLTPGEYTIIVFVDNAEPFNGEDGFALDFRGSASVEVPRGPAPVELDLPVTQSIHLTSPVDNQRTFGQTSDPKDTYSARPLSFEWDAIPEAVSYDVYLQLFKEPYTHLEPIREEHGVLDTSFAIDLPTNGYDEFYLLRLDAKNANDEPVGRLTAPYSNGHGRDYRFRIVEPIMAGNPDPAYSQWKRFVKPGVVEDYIAYVPRISDFGDFDSYVDDGSFLIIQGGGFENSVVGFRTWLYHDGSASYEVGISGDDGVALYCNGAFIVGRVNAEGSASYGIMELNSGWNKIEALVYNGPTHIELRLDPVLSTIGVVDANAYAYAPAPASGATIAATHEFPTEPLRGDRVFLNSGTLNGQQITSSNPFLSVTPGQAISGTVNLMVANDHGGHAVFPVEATPTWGDHQSGYWDVPISVPSYGTARRDVTIDLTAPSTPGVYAIIFAAQAEFSGGYITSATHWPSGSPRWNNGDDIAGWSASQIDFAIANGYLRAHQHESGVDFAHFGAAAVKIIVP